MSRPIGIRCPTCLGSKPKGNFQKCVVCDDRGWLVKPLDQLTDAQLRSLRNEIAEIPLDSDTAYCIESVRQNLITLFSGIKITSLEFHEKTNLSFHVNTTKFSLKIFPEFEKGKFVGINAIPLPSLELEKISEIS